MNVLVWNICFLPLLVKDHHGLTIRSIVLSGANCIWAQRFFAAGAPAGNGAQDMWIVGVVVAGQVTGGWQALRVFALLAKL
jgi:hypothetical protein